MCGFCGIVYIEKDKRVDPGLLKAMAQVIRHRGPDDEGFFIDGAVGLASRRLSIVGLSDGHMPMSTEDRSLWIAYNGELYNHPQLQKELTAKGYSYRTHADTESFLHLYQERGEAFLEPVRGMFGISLWDAKNQKLILARDRLGIKPVYYHFDGKALRFASEIKSILCDPDVSRELDLEALNYYLAYLAAPSPFSLFKGIKKLNPGEMLILENGTIRTVRYWKPEETIQPCSCRHEDDMKTELRRRLRDVVKEHLLADVPVGAFLSGGIDSSILVGLMHEFLGDGFKTFAIGFKDHALFDETPYARIVSQKFHTDHHELILSSSDLLNALQDITRQLDEPLADSSCFPVYFVSKMAAEQGKVVLSGDGGDEIFAGYRKYLAEYYRRYFGWLPQGIIKGINKTLLPLIPESRSGYWLDLFRQGKKFLRGIDPDAFERHFLLALHFEDAIRKDFLQPGVLHQIDFGAPRELRRHFYDEIPSLDTLSRMLWVDIRHGLPDDMLTKVDRMSMLHSLEVRVPFLDHSLVEFAFSLPGSVKLRGKETKWILKETFKDLLPAEILYRRKHGFDVPVGEWFKKELREVIEDVCSEGTVNRRGLFDPRQVQRLIKDHQDGKRDYNNQLWILLSLELWQRYYLDSPSKTM